MGRYSLAGDIVLSASYLHTWIDGPERRGLGRQYGGVGRPATHKHYKPFAVTPSDQKQTHGRFRGGTVIDSVSSRTAERTTDCGHPDSVIHGQRQEKEDQRLSDGHVSE